jgi:quercetin dioxygenase-like cupin family protein
MAPGDTIGLRPAGLPQLFCVIQGSGWFLGEDGDEVQVVADEAVFWTSGERHGVRTEHGLTALIVQAEHLEPDATLPTA